MHGPPARPRPQRPAPRADLVAHGLLVLLVGGFQRGPGGADVDLGALGGSRGGRNGVLVVMEQVSHQGELEANTGGGTENKTAWTGAWVNLVQGSSPACTQEEREHTSKLVHHGSQRPATRGKQRRRPSAEKRMHRRWYVHPVDCYATT